MRRTRRGSWLKVRNVHVCLRACVWQSEESEPCSGAEIRLVSWSAISCDKGKEILTPSGSNSWPLLSGWATFGNSVDTFMLQHSRGILNLSTRSLKHLKYRGALKGRVHSLIAKKGVPVTQHWASIAVVCNVCFRNYNTLDLVRIYPAQPVRAYTQTKEVDFLHS